MTEEQFMQTIEGSVNDAWDGATTKDEALKGIMRLFFTTLDPLINTKEHLELFIYRVKKMRELQDKYFKSSGKVKTDALPEAMKLERTVDTAISKLLSEMEYSVEKWENKEQQKSLFSG